MKNENEMTNKEYAMIVCEMTEEDYEEDLALGKAEFEYYQQPCCFDV